MGKVGQILPKSFLCLSKPFPGPLARGNRLFLDHFLSVPVRDSKLEASAVFYMGCMGCKKNQRAHCHVIP